MLFVRMKFKYLVTVICLFLTIMPAYAYSPAGIGAKIKLIKLKKNINTQKETIINGGVCRPDTQSQDNCKNKK